MQVRREIPGIPRGGSLRAIRVFRNHAPFPLDSPPGRGTSWPLRSRRVRILVPRLLPRVLPGLLIGVATSAMAVDATVQVTEVKVEGAKHVHPDRVRFVIDARPGKSYSLSQLQQAVRDDTVAIQQMGPFTEVRSSMDYAPDGQSVVVTYRFSELPYVTDVEFQTFDRVVKASAYQWRPALPGETGDFDKLGYFDRDKLKKLVTVQPGTWLNPHLLENDRLALQRKLQDDGHRRARVETETVGKDGNLTVIFRIGEGREIMVGDVVIEGLPDDVTMRMVERSPFNPAGLTNGKTRPYQPDLVAMDEAAIVRALQDYGYLDAKLVSTRREITDYVRPTDERRRGGPDLAPDGAYNDRVVLVYRVDPGVRYRLGKVSFIGNTVASSEALRQAFEMPEGAWYQRIDLEGDPRPEMYDRRDPSRTLGAVERSRRVISNQGYARCNVYPDRRLDLANHIVDLAIRIDEGGKYRVGRVDIYGNRSTRDAIIRRAMYLNPGDQWNDDQRDESLRQIERTGIFASRGTPPNPLKVRTDYPTERPNEVDLVVEVDERPTGSLNFELGFSSATGVYGRAGYTENNFDLINVLSGEAYRGGSQELSADVFLGRDRKSISSTWTNPHIYDGPYELSVTGYRSENSSFEWEEIRLGGNLGVARNFLRNDLKIGLNYGYTDLRIDNIDSNASDDVTDGKRFFNQVGISATYDRLDNRLAPTSGYKIYARQNNYGRPLPGSDQWRDLILGGDGFLPVWQALDGGVTYFHLGASYKQADSYDDDPVPFYARYRDGGAAPRHRGFGYGELSPSSTNKNNQFSRSGGTRDALTTLELSFPAMGTNDGIRLVGFVDHGLVWNSGDQVKPGDFRTAAGFGVRFPIALPVQIDFAWLLDRQEGESGSQVQFGLGTQRF